MLATKSEIINSFRNNINNNDLYEIKFLKNT